MTKGEETQRRILDTALRLTSREGLEGLSIGALAAETGMSKSGLFAHFGSKEELQLAVLRQAEEVFREAVIRPALKAGRGEPRLRALFERWLLWGSGQVLPGGCIFVALAAELDDKPGPLRDHLVASQRAWMGTLERAVALAVEEGHFCAEVDAHQVAFQLYAMILGYHHACRLLRDPRAEQHLRATFEDLIRRLRVH